MRTLHYAGKPGDGFGWGVCNANLIRVLSKHFRMVDAGAPDVVFMPLADHAFNPASTARGKINLAYCFFESELSPEAERNARQYDVVFCGSTWCLERMIEHGIRNGRVLIQGVDHDVFRSARLRVFSGGKFEYRKGQDIVIAAFVEFLKSYPDAVLVASWFNLWPQLIGTMSQSPHIRLPAVDAATSQHRYLERITELAGIPSQNIFITGHLSQESLANLMNQTDFGVFPNRCEGGTNLVLMEYLSCGKPAIVSVGTGHADIIAHPLAELLIGEEVHGSCWWDCRISEVVQTMLRVARHLRPEIKRTWTWESCAQTIADAIEELCSRTV